MLSNKTMFSYCMPKSNYFISTPALASEALSLLRAFGPLQFGSISSSPQGAPDTLLRVGSGDAAPLAHPKAPPPGLGHVHPQPRDLPGSSGSVAALAPALGQDTRLGPPHGPLCIEVTGDPALGAEHLVVSEPSQPRGAHRPSRRCPSVGFTTPCPAMVNEFDFMAAGRARTRRSPASHRLAV